MDDFAMSLFYFIMVIMAICLSITLLCLIAWVVTQIILDIIDAFKQRRGESK